MSHIPRILLVDDDSTIRFALERFLRGRGFQIDSAAEREEAEALIEHRQYDALLADLHLTRLHSGEGLELVSFARYRLPNIKVFLLTGFGTSEVAGEAKARGVDAFFAKPIPLEELGSRLESLLGKRIEPEAS